MTRAPQLRTAAGRSLLTFLHELHPGGHYSERVAAVEMEAGSLGERLQRLGSMALQFIRTTHGNELGHDHHCPWGANERPLPLNADCTCGWAALEAALAEVAP